MPEATAHYMACIALRIALGWSERIRPERSVRIASDLAVRWLQEHPRMGADPTFVSSSRALRFRRPTLAKIVGAGPRTATLRHRGGQCFAAPQRYGSIQERYAAMGVQELIVFDPCVRTH